MKPRSWSSHFRQHRLRGHAGDEASWSAPRGLASPAACASGRNPGYPDRANFGRIAIACPRRNRRNGAPANRALDARGAQPGRPHRSRGSPPARCTRGRAEYWKWRGPSPAGGAWDPRVTPLRPGRLRGCVDVWPRKWASGASAAEGPYADRRYEPRWHAAPAPVRADALITDPREAARKPCLSLRRGQRSQTICVHGDTPGAVDILKACREALL